MENPDANQLPEVDALPDGFVDGSVEHLAPPTPTLDQQKPICTYKDNTSEVDCSSASLNESSADEFQTSPGAAEKTQKLRTFPVVLSESENFDSSVAALGKDCTEQTLSGSAESSSAEATVELSDRCVVKEQHREKCQTSERPIDGGSDAPPTNMKEAFSVENVNTLKNKKPEVNYTKHKSVKRNIKSEQEFLEFTLKYQQVLAERDAAISVRDKLESLCRELQRQNKVIMEECKRVSTEGPSLRLELSNKFQDAIKDVSKKLDEQKDECLAQLKENEMLRTKLKQLADQFALSEQQFAQKLKQKTLELQIADLKTKQHEEKSGQEQFQIKLYAEQVSQLLATEKNLRLQLTADGEKFQQFQDALMKSNDVFETFKHEIQKMAKSIKELKKENSFLKNKTQKSDIALIELVDERQQLKKQLEKTKNQKEKLESLCRSLQAERKQNSTGSNNSESALAEGKESSAESNSSEAVPL